MKLTDLEQKAWQTVLELCRWALVGVALVSGSSTAGLAKDKETLTQLPGLMPAFRAQLGRVAVVTSGRPSKFSFPQATGRVRYASGGAAEGARVAFDSIPLPLVDSLMGCELEAVTIGAAQVVASGFGAMSGAVSARRAKVSHHDLRQAEEALVRAAFEMNRPDHLRQALLEAAREKLRRSLDTPGGRLTSVTDVPDYADLARVGVDTALQVEVSRLNLDRLGPNDPSYCLKAEAWVRLVRTRDHKVLYAEPINYRSGSALFIDWTLDDAEPFRNQVRRAYAQMANRIVEQLFLDRAPETRNLARRSRGSGIVQVVSPSLSPGLLSGLGRVGIVSTSTLPKLSLQRPLTKNGAMEEARRDAESFVDGGAGSGLLSELSASAVVVPFGLAEQVVAGIQGLTKRNFQSADDALTRAEREANPQESIRHRVLRLAQERTRHPVDLVPKPLPLGLERECSQMSCFTAGTLAWVPTGQTANEYLHSQGFDTVLEIELLHPALKQVRRRLVLPPDANPPLALSMSVRASLRRVADDDALYLVSMQYQGTSRKFATWAAHDADLFRRELETCYELVAAKIVEAMAMHAWPDEAPVEFVISGGGK